MALDQVDNDLGVGLGVELVPVFLERHRELAEVLHDPVQDDCDLPFVAPDQGVRVLFGDSSVRRPAGVPKPGGRLRAVALRHLLQVFEVAHCAQVVEPLLLEQREAGGVIAPVLEAL